MQSNNSLTTGKVAEGSEIELSRATIFWTILGIEQSHLNLCHKVLRFFKLLVKSPSVQFTMRTSFWEVYWRTVRKRHAWYKIFARNFFFTIVLSSTQTLATNIGDITCPHPTHLRMQLHSRFAPTRVPLYERVTFPYNEQTIDPSSPITTEWSALEFQTVINEFDGFYHKLMKK